VQILQRIFKSFPDSSPRRVRKDEEEPGHITGYTLSGIVSAGRLRREGGETSGKCRRRDSTTAK